MHNENRTEITAFQRDTHLAMTHLIARGLTDITAHGLYSPNNINNKVKDTLQQLISANKRAELLNYYTNHCTYIKCIKFTH